MLKKDLEKKHQEALADLTKLRQRNKTLEETNQTLTERLDLHAEAVLKIKTILEAEIAKNHTIDHNPTEDEKRMGHFDSCMRVDSPEGRLADHLLRLAYILEDKDMRGFDNHSLSFFR